MNIGTLAEMIASDASILQDVPAFLKWVNEQNVRRTRNVETVVNEEEYFESVAEMNGGKCTQADIDAAKLYLSQQPLIDAAQTVFDGIVTQVKDGSVKTTSDVAARFKAVDTATVDAAKAAGEEAKP